MTRSFDAVRAYQLLGCIKRGEALTQQLKPNTLARTLASLRALGLIEKAYTATSRYALTPKGKEAYEHLHALMLLTQLHEEEDHD